MVAGLLERLARSLKARGIPYMIIGGQAVLVYGEPRLTRDIDITLGAAPDRVPDVLDVARDVGVQPLVEPETFPRQTFVLPCQDPGTGLRVDFIFSVTRYEQDAIARGREITIGNTLVRFASPEDVIVHKIVAGRARDLEDVRAILAKRSDLDLDAIRRDLGTFAETTGEPLNARLADLLRGLS